MIEESIEDHLDQFCPKKEDVEKWDWESLKTLLKTQFNLEWDESFSDMGDQDELKKKLLDFIWQNYEQRKNEFGAEGFNDIQQNIFLSVLDSVWVEHLTYLEQLRRGIFLRAYGQKDPLIEFQKEAFRLFESMMLRTRDTFLEYIFHISIRAAEKVSSQPSMAKPVITQKENYSTSQAMTGGQEPESGKSSMSSGVVPLPGNGTAPNKVSAPISVEKIGRNDPCICGSGKKYKKCHGQ
jgi:preprotein translocase subunit SecA